MKKEYKPLTEKQLVGYLIEECGEVQAALGKSVRWGMESYNPELPEDQREYNFQWILRELKDLKRAIRFVEKFIKENY